MEKKSFWQRGNRGFVVSMVLVALVVIYVTATQIALSAEKRRVQSVADELQAIVVEALEMPLDECRAIVKDQQKAEKAASDFRAKLIPFFVEEPDYLNEAVSYYSQLLQERASNELDLTALGDPNAIGEVTIDEDTATVELQTSYDADGSRLVNDGERQTAVKGDISLVTRLSIMLQLEENEWKVYRVGELTGYATD